jgi:hypothetical protein
MNEFVAIKLLTWLKLDKEKIKRKEVNENDNK